LFHFSHLLFLPPPFSLVPVDVLLGRHADVRVKSPVRRRARRAAPDVRRAAAPDFRVARGGALRALRAQRALRAASARLPADRVSQACAAPRAAAAIHLRERRRLLPREGRGVERRSEAHAQEEKI